MSAYIKNLLPRGLKRKLREALLGKDWYSAMSFSQFGEDVILRQYFRKKKNGVFVDVGAYQPVSLSNTYYFYLKGWRGINIEPNPKGIEEFKKMRPEDTNLMMGVSTEAAELDYHMLDDKPYENSFSLDQVGGRGNSNDVHKVVKIKVDRLDSILQEHLKGVQPDFFSIDVEGLNLEVLQSNDWEKIRPKVVLIEKHQKKEEEKNLAMKKLMEEAGYLLDYDIVGSYIFTLPGNSLKA